MMKELLIFIVVFSALLIGMTTFYFGVGSSYGKTVNNISTLNQSGSIYQTINRSFEAAKNTTVDPSKVATNSITDSFWFLVNTAVNAVTMIVSTPFILIGMVTDINYIMTGANIGIPNWFITMITSTILILFIIFLLKFQREGKVE